MYGISFAICGYEVQVHAASASVSRYVNDVLHALQAQMRSL